MVLFHPVKKSKKLLLEAKGNILDLCFPPLCMSYLSELKQHKLVVIDFFL